MSGSKSKWKDFHSKYSPIKPADEVNKGFSDLPGDWLRLSYEDSAINDIPLKSYCKSYNNFKTIEDLKNFFTERVLSSIKQKEIKDSAMSYLLKTFHQGGLMYPVSSPLVTLLFKEAMQPRAHGAACRQLRITTTEEGFKIQEFYAVTSLLLMPQASEELQKIGDEGLITPSTNSEFVLEAEACIKVNFLSDPENPEITIESNHISYGNDNVKALLDKRNFLQILVDFFRNCLNLNKVIVPPKINSVITKALEDKQTEHTMQI